MTSWIFFTIALSIVEGIFFHVASKEKLDAFNEQYGDIHLYLTGLRAVVLFSVVSGASNLLAAALMFPFIHDGAYYEARNWFDAKQYPDGFMTKEPQDTTATFSFNLKTRTAMGVLAVLILIF